MCEISFLTVRPDGEILLKLSRSIRNREPQESIPSPLLRRFDELAQKALPQGVVYCDAARRLETLGGVEYENTRVELNVFCEQIAQALLH